jgi:hypothetical protein
LNGLLNENAFDRLYIPGVNNGFHAIMPLGIVAALAYVAEQPEVDRYLRQDLIATRKLPAIARNDMVVVNIGTGSNFSNYNMAFTGAWLALRYIDDEKVKTELRIALERQLYAAPGEERQPLEMKQSFFDFIYAAGMTHGHDFDHAAVERGLETLRELPAPPAYDLERKSCDDIVTTAGSTCTLHDGTTILLLGRMGRGDKLIAKQPIPMRLRPPSNYYWRSNPYEPNGGGEGAILLPGADFRVAYWMGRWIRI